MALHLENASFYKAVSSPQDFVRDGLPQIAFAGRSNVGKSSVINRLLGRKNLARTGASPGKTTRIQYYRIDDRFYLVDLPGYGYAKVSRAERERWGRLMDAYFQSALITLGVLIVDIRHPPSADDCTMHQWFRSTGCPECVVANKLDKLKPSQADPALTVVRETLQLSASDDLIPFSAEKGAGKDVLLREIVRILS